MKDRYKNIKQDIKDYADSLSIDFPIPQSLERKSYNYFDYSDSGLVISSDYCFDEIKIVYCVETHSDYNIENGYISTTEYHYISGVEIMSLVCDTIIVEDEEVKDYVALKILQHLESNKDSIHI